MRTLVESLFDKDLISKYPVDLSFLKTKHPQEKVDILMTLMQLLNDPFSMEEHMEELFYEHEEGFNFILQVLTEMSNKQRFDFWFDITQMDFEEMGSDMTDDEIDVISEELENFFSDAYVTQTLGRYLIFNKKLPDFLIKIIKDTGHWNSKMSSIDTWAFIYWPEFGPILSVYGCPKGLDPMIKKLLYN